MRLALRTLLSLALLAACTTSQEVSAAACDRIAAEAVNAANDYVSSVGEYWLSLPDATLPPLPEGLSALGEAFDESGCPHAQAADALRRHATDVEGDNIAAQAVRGAMLEGDTELLRLRQVIGDAQPPS